MRLDIMLPLTVLTFFLPLYVSVHNGFFQSRYWSAYRYCFYWI